MLRPITLALFLAFTFPTVAPASAQSFVIGEAVSGGGPSADTGEGIALADDGSRYVVGTFEGTATFGDVSVTSAGDSDVFLVKYDADGAAWVRRAGTDVFNDFGASVAVGPDGSVYAAGFFTGIATWDGGQNPDVELTTFSDFDAFVAKYTPEGDLEWVRQAGGTGQDTGRDLATDAEGNVYLVGGFEGVGTFGGVTLTSAGSTDAFLVKYAPDGDVVWARRGGSDQGDLAYGVAVTGGAAHVSGSFRGVAQFGALPIQSAGATDVFVVQYAADGEPVWVEGIGADGSEFTRGGGIGLDAAGNVYVTGSFSNTILVASDVLESTGFTDVFVAKLDGEGNELWGRRGGGDGTNFSAALAVDAGGTVLATGYVDGSGTFADEPIATQGRDGYLAVLDSAGDLITVELLGGTGQDTGTGVAANDVLARFAATGSFRGTASFGDLELTSTGSSDVYLLGGPTTNAPVPSTLFVDADATGAETGLSWTDAFTDLQDALALATELDTDSLAIWIAEGTYYPTDDGDRTISFELVSGIALYGGFDGTETTLDQRDPETHTTTLSGNLGEEEQDSDNSSSIITAQSVSDVSLDGLRIADGGGRIPGGIPILGAGLRAEDSDLRLTGVTFENNAATNNGGDGSGGAIYASSSTLRIENARFAANRANIFGGAMYGTESDFELVDTNFEANTAVEDGAAVFLEGGRISGRHLSVEAHPNSAAFSLRDLAAPARFYDVSFLRNFGDDMGSAMSVVRSEMDITNATFRGNMGFPGSTILVQSAQTSITNAVFAGNLSTFPGLLCESPDGTGSARLTNVTAVSNQTEFAVFGSFGDCAVEVQNSILWNNSTISPDSEEAFRVNIVRSVVEGGCPPESTCETVLDEDPLFAQLPPTTPDAEGDLRLREGSPAIDFGRAEFLPPDTFDLDDDGDTEEPLPVDLDGGPRVLGNEVDLGAYESPFAVALEPGAGVPMANALGAAYPNPFRDRTSLALDVADAQGVTVEVFDVLGRRVATVHDGPLVVGQHRVVIDAGGLPAGVYVVRAEGEAFQLAQRITLVR
jgi:hypothetical protein